MKDEKGIDIDAWHRSSMPLGTPAYLATIGTVVLGADPPRCNSTTMHSRHSTTAADTQPLRELCQPHKFGCIDNFTKDDSVT